MLMPWFIGKCFDVPLASVPRLHTSGSQGEGADALWPPQERAAPIATRLSQCYSSRVPPWWRSNTLASQESMLTSAGDAGPNQASAGVRA